MQGAAVLCLWPLVLGLASGSSYTRWREWLVPMHLALQHWIGLRFALPPEAQPLLASLACWLCFSAIAAFACRLGGSRSQQIRPPALLCVQATPGWARNMLPVFLATFCQPWLYLVCGSGGASDRICAARCVEISQSCLQCFLGGHTCLTPAPLRVALCCRPLAHASSAPACAPSYGRSRCCWRRCFGWAVRTAPISWRQASRQLVTCSTLPQPCSDAPPGCLLGPC